MEDRVGHGRQESQGVRGDRGIKGDRVEKEVRGDRGNHQPSITTKG